jgi:undecaprenyl-diphosphatase
MDIIHSVILGVVEGITEFLPISSTGHLILVSNLLKIAQTDFVKTFEIAIQSGAILSVIVLYFGKIKKNFELGKRVLVAFVPTGIIGFILYKLIKSYLIGNSDVVLISLLVGGIALIGVEMLFKRSGEPKTEVKQITYEKAAVIGVFQAIAVIPGVSRSAATIVGAMLLGVSRENATEFSFLLAVPTMLAATALDLKETAFNFNSGEWLALAVGFLTSFVVALFAIKWLVSYVKSNNFIPFGVYRIILSLLYFFLILK